MKRKCKAVDEECGKNLHFLDLGFCEVGQRRLFFIGPIDLLFEIDL